MEKTELSVDVKNRQIFMRCSGCKDVIISELLPTWEDVEKMYSKFKDEHRPCR